MKFTNMTITAPSKILMSATATGHLTKRWIKSAVAAVLVSGLLACGGGGESGPVLKVDANGNTSFDATALSATLATYPLSSLSAAEAAGLAHMREEEQLAHDVYAASATRYQQTVFSNIAESETTHANAIKALLDRYEQPDPLAGLSNGVFKTPEFQTLYNTLVATSAVSLIDALKVGVEIEELDMKDIAARMAETDNADIALVYDNLLRGSRNHLRSYMKALTQQGGTYVPKYISQAEFDAIVNSVTEKGG